METKEILDAVKGAVAEGVKPIDEGVKAVQADVKSVKDGQVALEVRVKKIEELPLHGKAPAFNRIATKHRGYILGRQFSELREKAAKNPEKFPMFANDQKAEEMAKFMVNFVKGVALKDVEALQELQAFQKANMVEGTDNVGGYLVPVEYSNDLITLVEEDSFALQNCNVITMASKSLKVPKEAGRVSVTWEDEAADIDESNATVDQVTLTTKKLAGLTDGVSVELLQDSMIDISGMLTKMFAYAKAQELDNQLFNGTGSPCSGVLTAAAGYSVVMTSLANFSSITNIHVSEMISKLSSKDAVNAKFVYNKIVSHYLRTLKDTANRPIYSEIAPAAPKTLYGLPAVENVNVTGTTGSSTAFVALGDFKKFYIAKRMESVGLDVDPYTEFGKALVHFRMISRWALAIGRNTAFCRLITG